MADWTDKETGKPMTRLEIIEAFEKEIGRSLTTGELEACLATLDEYEARADSRETP